MTMRTVGVMQDMPSRPERRVQRAMADADIERAGATLDIARLRARLSVAHAWIDLYFAERRVAVLGRIAQEARALAQAARARLAGGAGGVDDAIAAEIDAARIEDRRADLSANAASARAELRRWIGEAGDEPLATQAPAFAIDPERLREYLRHHPDLAAFRAEDAAAQQTYASRARNERPTGPGRSCIRRAAVEVRISLPTFQGTRQQPIIEARQADVARVSAERRAAEREHGAMLETQLAEHAAVSENLARLREVRLPLARRRAEAAAGAFAAGRTSATDMIVARRDMLEAEFENLELEQRLAALGAAMTLQYAEIDP